MKTQTQEAIEKIMIVSLNHLRNSNYITQTTVKDIMKRLEDGYNETKSFTRHQYPDKPKTIKVGDAIWHTN